MALSARLVLVDGTALLHRAYHAIPARFSTAAGLPTNVVYGFATMFKKVFAGRRPARGAVVFDPPASTAGDPRSRRAGREPMPEDLLAQLAVIDRLVAAHSLPRLQVAGHEADDVIGTLACRGLDAGMEIVIVAGDKGYAQLVGERVRMFDPVRDVVYDPELVRKRWGVRPEHFADFLALAGDRTDNIPGVPGIGGKGAAELLARYGSLAKVLANLNELEGRQRSALERHRDRALLSQELVTIDCRRPLEVTLDDLAIEPPRAAALNALYRELELFSLLADDQAARRVAVEGADHAACRSLAELDSLLADLPADEPVTVLPIHDERSPIYGPLAALVFSQQPATARLVPIFGRHGLAEAGLERLRPWLLDAERPKVTYNAKRLWIALRRQGLAVDGLVGDLLLESFLVDPTKLIPHRLGQITQEYLQRTLPAEKTVCGRGRRQRPFTAVELDALTPWACSRAAAVAEAWPIVRRRLVEEGHLEYLLAVDLPLAWVLGEMELAGIAVDPEELAALGRELGDRCDAVAARIYELAGRQFNLGSHRQVAEVLFDELGLPVIKRTKSGYSTDAEVLERLGETHEIARRIVEHRQAAQLINGSTKVLQSWIHPLTGRIHADFQQTAGATGRLITTDPDLQRTPVRTAEGRRIRRSFVAQPGSKLISADWSQIELRLLAHFSGDPGLSDGLARDVHAQTAGELFGVDPAAVTPEQRTIGKQVNFATLYGQGARGLARLVGVSRREARRYIDGYFRAHAGIRGWLRRTIAEAHERGFVETLFGRRRYIPELSSLRPSDRQYGERVAVNTPIQGSVADLSKLAMVAIARRFAERGLETRMVLQIHDELVFEAPDDEVDAVCRLVRCEMEGVYPLKVPLVADVGVGRSWAEAH